MPTFETLLIITGATALVAGLSLYFVLRERGRRKDLWRKIDFSLQRRQRQDDKIKKYSVSNRIISTRLAHRATNIQENLESSFDAVVSAMERLERTLRWRPRGLWVLWTRFVYEVDLTPRRFKKRPRYGSKKLARLYREVVMLGPAQREAIRMFKDALDPSRWWTDEKTGETVRISKLEWYSNMVVADKLKKESDLEEALTGAQLEEAKRRLDHSLEYVHLRHSRRSLEVGETPVTATAVRLTLDMVEKYWQKGTKAVATMEKGGADPATIITFIEGLLVNINERFEEKAKVVAKAEFTAGEIRGRLGQLKEQRGVEINIPKALKEALDALESKIPPLWANANWQELDTALEQIGEAFKDGREYLDELEAMIEDVDSVDARIKAVQVKEKRLKETYDIEAHASAEWTKALEAFDAKALKFWAAGAHDRLEVLLDTVEVPLKQHSTKVSNRLSEADREAGVTATAESDFESRLAEIAAAAAEPSNGSGIRRRQSATAEQPKQQTGKLVPYTTKLGITLQIDESQVELYRRMDATPDSR